MDSRPPLRRGTAALTLGLAAALALGTLAGCTDEEGPAPHILLISIDTLRRDALRAYDPDAQPLPAFDALAAESVRFEQAISPAGWTLPAHASMLTGLYPHRHGAVHRRATLAAGVPTLAETLAADGYETVAYTDGGFMDVDYGLARGFARYDAWSADGSPAPRWLPRRGKPPTGRGHDPFARAVAHLEHRDDPERPLFLFVHTYSLHDYFYDNPWARPGAAAPGAEPPAAAAPTAEPTAEDPAPPRRRRRGGRKARREAARAPQPSPAAPESAAAAASRTPGEGAGKPAATAAAGRRRNPVMHRNLRCLMGGQPCTPEQWQHLRDLYAGELRHLDRFLGELLATARTRLDDRPLWIVLTSDHGEGLDPAVGTSHHGGKLHPDLLAVPLLVAGPAAEPGRVDVPVSLVDLAPTLADLAGSGPYDDDADGRSLRPFLAGGLLAGFERRKLADRMLQAEDHYHWWAEGRRRTARDVPPRALIVAVTRGGWWYTKGMGQEQVVPLAGGGGEAPPQTLADLRRAAGLLLRERTATSASPEIDRDREAQLESLGYGAAP